MWCAAAPPPCRCAVDKPSPTHPEPADTGHTDTERTAAGRKAAGQQDTVHIDGASPGSGQQADRGENTGASPRRRARRRAVYINPLDAAQGDPFLVPADRLHPPRQAHPGDTAEIDVEDWKNRGGNEARLIENLPPHFGRL